MTWRTATVVLLVFVLVALIGYDVAALLGGGVEATISRVLLGWSVTVPLLAHAFGFLFAHFFWFGDRPGLVWRVLVTALSLVAVVIGWAYGLAPIVAGVAGIPVGRVWWPQPRPRKD